jgi:hypothetical protein
MSREELIAEIAEVTAFVEANPNDVQECGIKVTCLFAKIAAHNRTMKAKVPVPHFKRGDVSVFSPPKPPAPPSQD